MKINVCIKELCLNFFHSVGTKEGGRTIASALPELQSSITRDEILYQREELFGDKMGSG